MNRAGDFATARKGGLTTAEIKEAEALRYSPRPWSWHNLARRYGCCEHDVRRFFEPQS